MSKSTMAFLDEILRQVTKPARYTGQEWNAVTKDWDTIPIKVVLAYPDLYEIGMSNLGLAILYEILNREPQILAERVYAPDKDMETVLRQKKIPLFSLESKHPLNDFDIVGFSLSYELTYTNV
ncbi:MAG: B12-binding domain-containing radical SAM protein, partial [Chloroflexi bacterium]|nr:B12-binding domain-containing radical SAM protein [Chloroflexota bacterium]